MKHTLLAPSMLAANFGILAKQLRTLESAGAHMVHFDVMDGHFVPNLSFGLPLLESIRSVTGLPFDVHLMIERPIRYLERYAKAGADCISVHWEVIKNEAGKNMASCLNGIRSLGVKPAFAVNPITPIDDVFPFVDYADRILLMSVEPGFGGQKLLPYVLRKSEKLANYIVQKGLDIEIEMDGGINIENLPSVLNAGVNIVVSGTGLFSDSPKKMKKNIEEFLTVMKENSSSLT
jgi:ribulose-phosphate 3-epimerase